MRAASSSLRRRLLQGIGLAIWGPVALAQPGGKARRVGIVFSTDPRTSAPYLDALARGLEQHGYRRDRDFVVDVRHAEGRPERYPALVRELLDARAEVLVVGANSGVIAAKAATSTVPIVMAGALAPDAMGLVASLARPGGNVTGVANMSGSVTAKRLQLLHELVPGATRIAYLANPAVPGWDRTVKTVEDAGAAMALRISTATASTPAEIDRMLASRAQQRPDGIRLQAREMKHVAHASLDAIQLAGDRLFEPRALDVDRQPLCWIGERPTGRRPVPQCELGAPDAAEQLSRDQRSHGRADGRSRPGDRSAPARHQQAAQAHADVGEGSGSERQPETAGHVFREAHRFLTTATIWASSATLRIWQTAT